jgi:HupE / UreJ protein
MTRLARASMAVLLGLLCVCPTAKADSHSVSGTIWSIAGRDVILRFIVPTREARLLQPGAPDAATAAIGSYVLSHVYVQAGGAACPAIDQGFDIGLVDPLSVGTDLYGFEIMFRCPSANDIVLGDAALFDVAADHIDFARVALNAGDFVPQLFTAAQQRLHIIDGAGAPPAAPSRYLRLGWAHMLHSVDRLCLLLALLLLAPRWRDRMRLLGGLMLGYAMAVAIATQAPITTHASAIDAWIGFMVIFAAAIALTRAVTRPRFTALVLAGALLLLALAVLVAGKPQAAVLLLGAAMLSLTALPLCAESERMPLLWLLPAALGLLDGFSLPSDLSALQWSSLWPASAVIAFNLGAALGAALLMAAIGVAMDLGRGRAPAAAAAVIKDLATSLLAGLGSFWLLSRLMV